MDINVHCWPTLQLAISKNLMLTEKRAAFLIGLNFQ